ncbi:S-layer homology domain-containing protein [Bacillus tuaregi]|uniref:S-layer homology domain-containing protein n=1 Tax=Bacillus tuaregi TaxID=1816695 RepID=UPI0008F87789|nr:S-layer homology domain-containing protein [Bacillus tuaregi]
MRKKFIGGLLGFLVVAGSLFSFQQPSTAYAADDITGITLEKEMRAMAERGVMKGYDDGSYQPFTHVSRGQFATLISRALDLPEGPAKFPDVPNHSQLASGINRASAAGIVNGYTNGNFGMSDEITRDQMAKMIDNALVYLKVERKAAPLSFKDASSIGDTFKEAVAHAVYDEIVKGKPVGTDVYFEPKKTATRAEAAAFIYRMLRTASPEYNIATIDSNQNLIPGQTVYSSLAEANNAISSPEQVITRNDKVVKMTAGLVYSKPPFGSQLTNIYKDQNFTSSMTYVNANQEMEYLESTDDYVKISIAGTIAYVKHREVSLIPTQQVKGKSYYEVDQAGNLLHRIYNPADNTYESAYISGKAPTFLTAGARYYSQDGGVFTDANGQEVGTAYPYFNYLPARTVTNYTGEEFNQYIQSRLAEVEALYNSDPKTYKDFKDATKISKIIGLGSYIKEAESKYKINGLVILSMAMHESKYGMSFYAQDRNNLFGLNAVDNNPDEADAFDSVEASIDALATEFLNKNYINPLGRYANGAVLGNKSRGFNVMYASDPYWGQKIAGHMYRVDQYLGGKDFAQYQIGETKSNNLNVRSTPVVEESNLQFSYKAYGMPVAILDTMTQPDGSIWHKVLSDHMDYNEAFIYSVHVQDMPIAK